MAKPNSVRLVLSAKRRAGELLGAMAAPPHLDAAVWRWPGEPEDSFYRRLLSLVRGSGVVHVRLLYRGDLAAPPVSSLLH